MRVCERVILEIMETERAYVGHLNTLATVFIDPLQQRAGTRGEVLSEAAITNVFGNVKQLHVLNSRFLGELERAMDTGALCSLDTSLERIKRVSDVFLDCKVLPFIAFQPTHNTLQPCGFAPTSSLLTPSHPKLRCYIATILARVPHPPSSPPCRLVTFTIHPTTLR
jgi:hypothetical protein